ncbi:hypothetical protein RE428_43650 [Marinobacter nanhaiticus D15-8W]|uniref:Solute-binding protein family 3/N-terminal domain-containing protein n=1 Tax=Marinobacter nanhaiticus D15-8W TaxID=626887 RepID=N6VZU2_9GAMM|nr:transporter substrate-binding domain-containing protein [Marinobacter nanhaiticus]ENO15795.1 hypothetical protein J057_10601 [Marinobacter nanhaiticus D15-8W]BES73347.1 hypothetical protein RE428_43650 [Marinobacter nanhaiticus D15-8W]
MLSTCCTRRGLLVLCIVFLMLFASWSSAQTLNLVTEAWPPLIVDTPQHEPQGPLWTITRSVAQRMGVDVYVRFVPWKRALDQVARSQKDGVIGAARTRGREKVMRFSEEPLLYSETAVFSLRRAPVRFDDGLSSLTGKRVAVSAGYSYNREVWSAPYFERVEVRDIQSGLQLVMMGRVDAFLVNRDVGWYEARQLGIEDQLVASAGVVSGGPVYLAFSPSVSPALIEDFDRALRAFRDTEEYRRLMLDFSAPVDPSVP